MFPNYFPRRYFAPRYWPKSSSAFSRGNGCGCNYYGDGSVYGDGETYCNSDFVRKSYLVVKEVLSHYLSVRIQATGRFVLDSLRALVMRRTEQPHHFWVQADVDQVMYMSFRISGTGCLKLTSVRPVVNIRNQQPVQ